jgi:DNA polymerase elongation subunit (family B)
LPLILEELLAARKSTRTRAKYKTVQTEEKKYIGLVSTVDGIIKIKQADGEEIKIPEIKAISINDTYNSFEKAVFDKRQLGFKVAANSVYGQCGATTSDFYECDIAASTTATGRALLIFAKLGIETVYKDRVCDTKYGSVIVNAEVIYGDTDSCFFRFNMTDLDGVKLSSSKELKITIELAQEAGALISKMLKKPHDLEYEKTFMPWCLLSKKRYVGMQYEFDPNKCKRKSMGIVLKRRDNAEIVKEVYGGVIDILMKNQDVIEAVRFVKERLEKLAEGGYPIEKLKITKSIRGFYKKPKQIAHKVLADRMGKRDPGNKPSSGTRIPFAYILKKGAKLQGDKIETLEFIKKNGLKLDYGFYITNQIMKPLLQVFALDDVMCKIPGINRLRLKGLARKIKRLKETTPADKFLKKAETLKTKIIKEVIFNDILRDIRNKSNGAQNITDFFQLKNNN